MILPLMAKLTQISNHLEIARADRGLLSSPKNRTADARTYRKQLAYAQVIFGIDGKKDRSPSLFDQINTADCGKLKVLKALLDRWQGQQHKVLLFSNSLVLLTILGTFLRSLWADSILFRLDGATKNRSSLCDAFNAHQGFAIFLISTRAGGEGLNLATASKVVIMDPNWNPACDLQAQDRAYRIGQTQRVNVYRLIAQGTIEEIKYLRQVKKQQISRSVLENSVEKRLFQESDFMGMRELLRYSKSSFTKSLYDRWSVQREKYLKQGKSVQVPGVQKQGKENSDDVRDNDDFSIYAFQQDGAPENEEPEKVNWLQLVGNSEEEAEWQADQRWDGIST
jgi:SNF2 family DNA or RNA helicase